jgi:hypothetical protein
VGRAGEEELWVVGVQEEVNAVGIELGKEVDGEDAGTVR